MSGCIHVFLLCDTSSQMQQHRKTESSCLSSQGPGNWTCCSGSRDSPPRCQPNWASSGAWRSPLSLHGCWQSPICWCCGTDCGLPLPSSWWLTEVYSHLPRLPLPFQAALSQHGSFTVCRSLSSSPLVLVTQSCPTLCDSTDCSPPGSSVHGILQTRMLEWVAISF